MCGKGGKGRDHQGGQDLRKDSQHGVIKGKTYSTNLLLYKKVGEAAEVKNIGTIYPILVKLLLTRCDIRLLREIKSQGLDSNE